MIKLSSVFHIAAVCLPLTLITSCGAGSTEAVQGTTINIDPSAPGQATTLGFFGSNSSIFRIEARSPSGTPQINVGILIDSQYTVYAGHPTVDCVAVFDSAVPPNFLGNTCTAPGATPLTVPYETTTGQNGTYEVTVIYSWGSGGISGSFTAVQAWSGTGYGASNITFTCADPDTATAPACP